MVKNSGVRNLACAFFFFGTLVLNSYGQTYTVTVNYEANFGANPESPLISVFQNNFYGGLFGTTFSGGDWNGCGNQWGCGTISGGGNPLYSFCSNPGCTDGSGPASGLVQTTTGNLYGNLYGATQTGGNNVSSCGQYGCGTIFEYSFSNNTLTTLHAFSYTDGAEPTAGLIQATDGNLYGVTRLGGANGDYGTVFQITLAGQFTTLYNFCPQSNCPDGRTPYGPLVQGTDGNLYGVTAGGGTHGNGTVFRITTKGKLTTLYSFCALTTVRRRIGSACGLDSSDEWKLLWHNCQWRAL